MLTKELPKNVKIAVAVSGGADSVALLDKLVLVAEERGLSLSVVHCEHGIRGEDSLLDAAFVRDLAGKYRLKFTLFSEDCPALAKSLGVSLETAAREFRYRSFSQLLDEGAADFVALAHHKDDRAETVLFRLSRGTSLGGVLGMSLQRGKYLRPLLDETKAEILAYVEQKGLPYRQDQTNFQRDAARNRIRLDVLPALEEAVPGARGNLVDFAVRAKEDDEYLYALCERLIEWESPLSAADTGWSVSIDAPPIFRRACLTVLKKLGLTKNYTQKHLQALCELCVLQTGMRAVLPRGIIAVRSYEKIRFLRGDLDRGTRANIPDLPFSCGEFAWGRYALTVKNQPIHGANVLRLDGEKIPYGVVIRSRREGDIFRKFGGGEKSLKKYFIDRKIPKEARDGLPLLAYGGEILAIFGVEIAESVKITERTKKIIYLKIDGRK